MQNLQLLTSLMLGFGHEFLEQVKGFTLLFHRISGDEPQVVINKGNEVLETLLGDGLYFAYIGEDSTKNFI